MADDVADRPGARRGRWRWSAGWSSWAAPPAPSPASRPGSRCRARWSPAAGFDQLAPELLAEIADELNVGAGLLPMGGSLVDTTAKANFRRARQAFRQGRAGRGARRSPRPTRRRSARPRCGHGHGVGRGRRRDGRRSRRTRSLHRDAARGLGGRLRLRRHGRPRPADHPVAAAGGPGPGRDPADPGGAQDSRARGVGPDRAALSPPSRRTPRRCRNTRPDRRRGPGDGLRGRGRRRLLRLALHRRAPVPDVPPAQGVTPLTSGPPFPDRGGGRFGYAAPGSLGIHPRPGEWPHPAPSRNPPGVMNGPRSKPWGSAPDPVRALRALVLKRRTG